jgi:hypothetical protein
MGWHDAVTTEQAAKRHAHVIHARGAADLNLIIDRM